MELELKTCPFCGEMPKIIAHFKHPMFRLFHRCKVFGYMEIGWTKFEVDLIERWNTREGGE